MVIIGFGHIEAGRVADAARRRGRPRRIFDCPTLETIAYDPQWEEVLALLAKDDSQQVDIVVVELAVPTCRSLGIDQALALEESDLRNRDVGKLLEQKSEHFADGQVGTVGHHHVSAVGALEEDQSELADLQLVALMQDEFVVDPLSVDIRAVE